MQTEYKVVHVNVFIYCKSSGFLDK